MSIDNASPTYPLSDPGLHRRLNQLRQTDNITNWYYLAREYLFLATVVGVTIAHYYWLAANSLSFLWAIPLTLITITLVGAGQHRLVTLTHEAAHYMLFRNRKLNEFVSEWFCMYPVLGTTHSYRVQHIGHHQYPNDPDKDPDWWQLRASGHRFTFPMSRGGFVWHCIIKQSLFVWKLIQYVLVRAFFKVDADGPYKLKQKGSRFRPVLSLAFLLSLIGCMAYGVWTEDFTLLAIAPAAIWTIMTLFLALVPISFFVQYTIANDLPVRVHAMMRTTYMTLLISALCWLTVLTKMPWWLFYVVLWLVPLGTSFAFFMLMRQIVQHGNAPRDRLTNTRIFEVAWPIRFAVFPIGNDYHLPHHMFPMIPHYNLRKAHDLLMNANEYRNNAILVDGYFFHSRSSDDNPTVLDLMTH